MLWNPNVNNHIPQESTTKSYPESLELLM